MTFAAACRIALAVILGATGPVAAQQVETPGGGTLPRQFSTGPQSPGAPGQPLPKFELPPTLPSIPSGVAIIPPPEGQQGQRPQAPAPPLPTTTPLPPADVATPVVPPTIPPEAPNATPSAAQPSPSVAPSPVPSDARRPQPSSPAPASTQAPAAPPVTVQTSPLPPVVTPPAPGRPDVPATPSIPPSFPTYPMFSGIADGRSQLIRLTDMGRPDGIHLEGAAAEAGVTFSARQDEAFVSSRISLAFSYSNAVARDDGELLVFLNNEPVGSVALGKARGPKSRAEFTFSPALLATDNRLHFRFALKGSGANACKLARDRRVWVNIEPATFIYLGATRLPLADDLSVLPRPFADPKDPLPLVLPFVLPPDPGPAVLQAAGMAAAYFGLIAANRSATFPVQYDGLPASNAVVLVLGDDYPPGVAAIPGEGPRVAVVTNPSQVDSKLLLVIGADTKELQEAAATLAVAPARLSGGWSAAHELLPPERKAYDAPKWISSTRPVRLGELVGASALTGRLIVDSPRVSFRTAPDLFFGALSGGTMYLRIHRADDTWIDVGESRVIVDLNRKTVGEVPLEPKLKVLSRLKEWLFPSRADERVSQVLLPGYQLSSANRLDFRFELKAKQDADCDSLEWSDRTGIDPDSTIDLTRVAHFAAFPNLAFFANAGFPFTKYADLSDTAFVMSDKPSAEEAQVLLNLLGMMAGVTGIAATRYTVVDAQHAAAAADRHLVVIGLDSSQPLLREWAANNSVRVTSTSVAAAAGLTPLQRLLQPDDPRAPYYRGAALELARATLGKPYAYLSSFWSPLNADRLVVMIGATQPALLVELSKRLDGVDPSSNIQGDFYYFSEGKGEFYTSGRVKFVGRLPIWWQIQWLAGSFGLAAFILVICVIFIFAAAIERFAAHRAHRLLLGPAASWRR